MQQSTWGRLEETGTWSIDIALGRLPLGASINAHARGLVETFLVAFEQLCIPKEVRYERVLLGDAGQIIDEQSEKFGVNTSARPAPANFASANVVVTEPWVITTAFVSCDTLVTLPQLESGSSTLHVPDSAELYLGYLVESDEREGARIVSCRVAFETSIDAWVRETREPANWTWRDNRAIASPNQPSLARALRAWEQGTGSPITEWVSRHYSAQIVRFGFV